MLTSAEVTDLMLELILHMTKETVRLEACRFHGHLPKLVWIYLLTPKNELDFTEDLNN